MSIRHTLIMRFPYRSMKKAKHTEVKRGESTENPIDAFWKIMSSPWDWHIISKLTEGKKGFNELKRSVRGISSRALSQRLNHLKSVGIVNHKKILSNKTIPYDSEYSLTPIGKKLLTVMEHAADWMVKYHRSQNEKRGVS